MELLQDIGQYMLRLVLIFFISLSIVRFMGNRTVGQFSPFDFVIMVGIGDILITVSLDQNIPLLAGFVGLATLVILQQLLAYLALKSLVIRKWVEGTPVTIVQNGKLLKENMRRTQFNYDDLRQELHKLGLDMTDLPDIQCGRLESCGAFSVVKKSNCEPMTRRDLQEFIQNLEDNPLSPFGKKWNEMETFMQNVQELADYVKKQNQLQTEQQSEPKQN